MLQKRPISSSGQRQTFDEDNDDLKSKRYLKNFVKYFILQPSAINYIHRDKCVISLMPARWVHRSIMKSYSPKYLLHYFFATIYKISSVLKYFCIKGYVTNNWCNDLRNVKFV